MPVTSISEMWARLDTYSLDVSGKERPVNHLNEWGGFSRKLQLPVFTAWVDHTLYDKASKTTSAVISDTEWRSVVGVNNQERWIKHSEDLLDSQAAFFIIHAVDNNAHPRKIKAIDDDRVFIGKLLRRGTETVITGQSRQL